VRILLLIIQFPPDVNSTGVLMAQVCEELQARGHEVSVVTTFPHYEHFRVWDEYRGKLYERGSYRGMNVLRTWVYASGTKQRMGHRLLSYLSFNALATATGLLSRHSYDVLLCTNGSFFTGVTAYVRTLAKQTPFVYNVQDLYPETPVAAGQLTSRRAIAALERLERFMYAKAAHISVIAPAFRSNIMTKGVAGEKISVVPNFVDTDFIRPLPRANAFSAEHGLTDRFVVTHAGNLGYVYDLNTMLDAAALLRHERDVLFLLIGEGVSKPALQRKAEALGLDNVRFLPFQPQDNLPWLRAASDVAVSLYKHGSARYSMPSKVYEIMASGRPLLASADRGSDVWSLVEQTGCGVCVEPEDAPALADAVLHLARNRTGRDEMSTQGRHHAEASYSRQAVGAQYEVLLRRVASQRTPVAKLSPGG
jgi:colanic acid biosynthesis glycosyl transferase WcaI